MQWSSLTCILHHYMPSLGQDVALYWYLPCFGVIQPCFICAGIAVPAFPIRLRKGKYTHGVPSSSCGAPPSASSSPSSSSSSSAYSYDVAPRPPRPPPARTSRLLFIGMMAWMSCHQKEGRGKDGWRAVIRTAGCHDDVIIEACHHPAWYHGMHQWTAGEWSSARQWKSVIHQFHHHCLISSCLMSSGCAWMPAFCVFTPAGAVFRLYWYCCACFLHTAETGEYTHGVLLFHHGAPPSASSRLSADDNDDASDDDAIVATPHLPPHPARTSRLSFAGMMAWMSCHQKEGRGGTAGKMSSERQAVMMHIIIEACHHYA